MTSTSPYEGLPSSRFWKTGVSQQDPLTVPGLYAKRFGIRPTHRIATAGSCFAQHIGRNLRAKGFAVIDAEPIPPRVQTALASKYGYRLYSARYGNIYTARQLVQLAREAYGEFEPANRIWERNGRFFDAMRPSVEPEGLKSADDVIRHRRWHLEKVREVLDTADVFVFTFGLTESWIDRRTGTVYPVAPGTIAGAFDEKTYAFKNFSYEEVLADFVAFRELLKNRNPTVKFVLTVSPVPLTATATSGHVLLATTYSKSVLRAVAGKLFDTYDDVDYFPSYEIIVSPFTKGSFYEQNMRSVTDAGVEAVMRIFFAEHGADPAANRRPEAPRAHSRPGATEEDEEGLVCEDLLLEAFAR